MKDAWIKLKELQEHPELANTPGYELDMLVEEGDPIDWFLLLMEQPQLAPDDEWWFNNKQVNPVPLPWGKLLARRPEFEKYCRWETVSRLDLVELAFLAPEIFERNFPNGKWHDLYAFLTPQEVARLLSDAPQAVEKLDMEEVAKFLAPDTWLWVIEYQPQLEKYFDWSTVEKRASLYWEFLLKRQPQFAEHCDFSLLRGDALRRILCRQPQLVKFCDWSKIKMSTADRQKLLEKGIIK